MKRLFFIFLISLSITACDKENKSISEEVLPPPVKSLNAYYDKYANSIDVSWQYASISEINNYQLFYSPGGGTTFIDIEAYNTYFHVSNAIKDTTYLFNVRVVDKLGNRSEGKVIRIFTSKE